MRDRSACNRITYVLGPTLVHAGSAVLGLLLCLAVSAIAGCGRSSAAATGLPYYNSADFTAVWPDSAEAVANAHRIAAFALNDQRGNIVTEQTLRGRVTLANFFFTTCQGVCPKMAENYRRVQAHFRDDARMLLVSHSVTPEDDTPESMAAYALANQVSPERWLLLTGDKATIYRLARRSYFAEKSLGKTKGDDEFLHTENMLLVDQQGHLRGVYNATLALEADRAIADAELLMQEPKPAL